jgi:hypothetical protein
MMKQPGRPTGRRLSGGGAPGNPHVNVIRKRSSRSPTGTYESNFIFFFTDAPDFSPNFFENFSWAER